MRNVVKGFQFSHIAVPKLHEVKINQHFTNFHGPRSPSPRLLKSSRPPTKGGSMPANARRPGKNVGVKGGYKV